MEDILEMILSVIYKPFEDKYEKLFLKINKKKSKFARLTLKALLFIIPLSFIFGFVSLCSYIFRGYWF